MSHSPISVRPARPDDCSRLGALRAASIAQLCGPDHGGDAAVIAAWAGDGTGDKFTALLARPDITLLVAERQGVIVGLGACAGDLITLNYVDPDHRFTGVSKAIMAALETGMVGAGLNHARLNSTQTAIGFYEALGWACDGLASPETGQPMRKALAG